jgi:FkbM family methyltransferase
MKYYSQYEQDKWLHENYFKDKKDGVFLEIGADDGVDKSNSKFFEETLGWSGICIEPSPKRFKLLEQNRNCILENCAVSDSVGEVEFMDIAGWGKGLSGIVEKYDAKHKQRIETEVKHPQNKGRETITVKTDLLSNILDRNGITEIDFCTIDTEGGEYDILKSIDLKKYKINIILVENNYNETKTRDLLIANGYKLHTKLSIDDVFIKE